MGIGWTNVFQGIFMLIIAWFLGLYLPYKFFGGVAPMFNAIAESSNAMLLEAPGLSGNGEPWDWWGFSSAVIVSGIGFSMWPHFFMKSFAAKSDRSLKLSIVLYPTFQIFLVPILLIGFTAVLIFPGVEPADTILPYVLTQIELPIIIIGLVCAGTLAASMSSGDAILHAAASVGVRDGISKLKAMDDKGERFWIRVLIIVISVISYYFAVISDISIVSLLLGAYGGIAQIFPIVFAMFYWPRANTKGAYAGLIGGILTTLLFLNFPEWKPVPAHEGLFGLIVNVTLLVSVSLLTKPLETDRIKRFIPL